MSSNATTQVPEQLDKWTADDIAAINRALRNLVPILPYINSVIGTKPPDPAGWTNGLLAYADGTNWNPCNISGGYLCWYDASVKTWKSFLASSNVRMAADVPSSVENTTPGGGLILASPDGTRWQITVANNGALASVKL